jgi:hypothetical protein
MPVHLNLHSLYHYHKHKLACELDRLKGGRSSTVQTNSVISTRLYNCIQMIMLAMTDKEGAQQKNNRGEGRRSEYGQQLQVEFPRYQRRLSLDAIPLTYDEEWLPCKKHHRLSCPDLTVEASPVETMRKVFRQLSISIMSSDTPVRPSARTTESSQSTTKR